MPAQAQERLVHDRGRSPRLAAVLEGLVDPLRAGQSLNHRILGGVLGRGRRLVEGIPVAGEGSLEARPGVLLQRGEDLIDLHRGGGLRHRDGGPARQVRSARASGLHVEEEVALQKQPRPDDDRGVPVDRQPLVGHREGHVRLVAVGLDRGHLAHVHPGDADGRRWLQRGRVFERRVQLVALAGERDVLRERQVKAGREQDHQEKPDPKRPHPVVVAAEDPLVGHRLARVPLHRGAPLSTQEAHCVPSLVVAWSSGGLPTTTRFGMYFSLPAAQTRGCPGAAVYG